MRRFDEVGAHYDDLRWETAMRARRERMKVTRAEAMRKATDAPKPEATPPTNEGIAVTLSNDPKDPEPTT